MKFALNTALKARSQVYKEIEERVPLNPKSKYRGLEENSAVVTQVKKEHCKNAGSLSGKVKDMINYHREWYGCSDRSTEQINTEGRSKAKTSKSASPDLSRMM